MRICYIEPFIYASSDRNSDLTNQENFFYNFAVIVFICDLVEAILREMLSGHKGVIAVPDKARSDRISLRHKMRTSVAEIFEIHRNQ
jgi:hypothetical protein